MDALVALGFDFETLQKGDMVPTGAIEQWAQLSREHVLFGLAMLKCGQHVAALLRAQGRPATVVRQGFLLRVLTDREATTYQDRRFHRSIDRMHDAHSKSCEVEMAALTESERLSHLMRLQVQQMYLHAVARQAAQVAAGRGGGQRD